MQNARVVISCNNGASLRKAGPRRPTRHLNLDYEFKHTDTSKSSTSKTRR